MPEYANQFKSISPSIIREFQQLSKEYKVKYNLGIGDCEVDTPQNIQEATIKAIQNGHTHYESNQGNESLRNEIRKWEINSFTKDYPLEGILITQGATHAIYLALQAILNENDEVLVPLPAYPLYKRIIKNLKGFYIPISLPKNSNNLEVTLQSQITPKTKAILINHPQNPTGKYYTKEEIIIIKDFVLKNNLYLVVDECYIALQYTQTPTSFTQYQELNNQLFICRSFSKAWAMTGYRLGYLVSSPLNIKICTYLLQSSVSCIASFIQQAGIVALNTEPLTNHYKKKSQLAYNYLTEVYNIQPIESGLYYFLPTKRNSEEFVMNIMKECSIASVPGTAFDYDGFYRISLCASDDTLQEALQILMKYAKEKD